MPKCPTCKQPLTKAENIFCSKQCANARTKGRQRFPVWSKAEISILQELAGECPLPLLVKRYRNIAGVKGFPLRSKRAIEQRLGILKISYVCIYDYFSSHELARILGITAPTVRRWYTEFGLPHTRPYPRKLAISRADFKVWVDQNPHRVAYCDPEGLSWVLEDDELLQRILSLKGRKMGEPVPVQRLDTGQVYPSAVAASKELYLNRHSIARSIAFNRPVSGIQWRYLEESCG